MCVYDLWKTVISPRARRSAFLRTVLALLLIVVPGITAATEGALGRPIAGTGVTPNVGVVPPTISFSLATLLKVWDTGPGAGPIIGTVQQLDDDTGPTANELNGFVGHEWNGGPIVTYDTKLAGKAPLGFSLRWVPSIESDKRLSGDTIMATATLIF